MTREYLEQELLPLDWRPIGRYGYRDEDVAAPAESLNYWYVIFRDKNGYTVNREEDSGRNVIDLANGVKTIEEAKAIAWKDYVDEIEDLSRIEP